MYLVAKLCPLSDPVDLAHQAPLSMGFPWQEYWSGLPFPLPGNLQTWVELVSPVSPALQVDSLSLSHWGLYMVLLSN